MQCTRRSRRDGAANIADSEESGLSAWWHRLHCEECCRAHAADLLMERAAAQMLGEPPPSESLAKTLAAVGCSASALSPENRGASRTALGRALALVGLGIFVTTLAQPDSIGESLVGAPQYPAATAQGVAGFWALVGLFWYLKPVAAVILESVPGLISRRRLCLFASVAGAALLWLLPGLSMRSSEIDKLFIGIGVNALLALASTILGGFLVEQAHRIGASGRLGALHLAAAHLAGLAAPILGLAAGRAAGPMVAAVLLAAFGIMAAFLLPEDAGAHSAPLVSRAANSAAAQSTPVRADGRSGVRISPSEPGGGEQNAARTTFPEPRVGARSALQPAATGEAEPGRRRSMAHCAAVRIAEQARILAGARGLWQVALLLLLVIGPSSFEALLTKQQATNGFLADQRLHLSWVAEAATLVSIFAYTILCRRVRLRSLLPAGILANAGGTLLYLAYAGRIGFAAAAAIEVVNGLAAALIVVTLFDLAVRAVPRQSPYLGYAILMSVANAARALSEVATASLSLSFATVVVLSAVCSALALFVVVRLPSALVTRREGEPVPGAAQWARG